MRAFTELFHTNCGMPQNTIMPAYGMAESTLAISLKLAANTMTTNVVDLTSFQSDGVAKAPEDEMLTVEHVSCGPVFPKHEIAVMDEAGHHLGECHEGELCLRGPSVTPGYYNNPEATAYAWRGGWLHTGDLGYVREGEVYVTGRIKDLIILNGRNMHPQSIEWAAADVDGVRKGNVVAFSRPGASSEELVIALETRETDHEALMAAVKKAVRKEISVTPSDIVCLTPGTLPKTSSGKLQRRKTRQQYLAGSLGNEGNRTMGTKGSSVTVARHVARSVWSRAKNAMGR
jgi:fatty-acyl-CoA synthase